MSADADVKSSEMAAGAAESPGLTQAARDDLVRRVREASGKRLGAYAEDAVQELLAELYARDQCAIEAFDIEKAIGRCVRIAKTEAARETRQKRILKHNGEDLWVTEALLAGDALDKALRRRGMAELVRITRLTEEEIRKRLPVSKLESDRRLRNAEEAREAVVSWATAFQKLTKAVSDQQNTVLSDWEFTDPSVCWLHCARHIASAVSLTEVKKWLPKILDPTYVPRSEPDPEAGIHVGTVAHTATEIFCLSCCSSGFFQLSTYRDIVYGILACGGWPYTDEPTTVNEVIRKCTDIVKKAEIRADWRDIEDGFAIDFFLEALQFYDESIPFEEGFRMAKAAACCEMGAKRSRSRRLHRAKAAVGREGEDKPD